MIGFCSVSGLLYLVENFRFTFSADLRISLLEAPPELVVTPFQLCVFRMIRVIREILRQGRREKMLVRQASLTEDAFCGVLSLRRGRVWYGILGSWL